MSDYQTFLARKEARADRVGVEIDRSDLHPLLHDFQRDGVTWAVRAGRGALFWDCGLGKTFAQIEWARHSGDTCLIVAPLSVARQTVRESKTIDAEVNYVRRQDEVTGPGLWITNYEMIHWFDPERFDAVVLDESSILKSVDGKIKARLIDQFRQVPRRLACSATPAPNDVSELANHAEFLGVMRRAEMLAAYFINDEKDWRLKGHAAEPMYRWMTSWAHAMRRPSDLGYPDAGYKLPPLNIIADPVEVDMTPDGQLFATELGGVGGRAKVRRQTLMPRAEKAAELTQGDEQWIIWCGLNDEASAVEDLIGFDAANVDGKMPCTFAPASDARSVTRSSVSVPARVASSTITS